MSQPQENKRIGWVLMFTSLAGVVVGFPIGLVICSAVLHAQGRGEYQADALTTIPAGVAGSLICAVVFPTIFFLILSRRKR